MDLDFTILAIGCVAAFVNTVAGGGSLLTLPALILLGIPPDIANGTNRLAVLVQSSTAGATFRRQGIDPWPLFRQAWFPFCLGAAAGAMLASFVDPQVFRRCLAVVLVAMVFAGGTRLGSPLGQVSATGSWRRRVLLLGLGLYTGFIQAGIGVWLLLVLPSVFGGSLRESNATKVALVGAATALALAVFAWRGQVDWYLGGVLSIGGVLGAWAGARWASHVSESALRRVLLGAMILLAVGMWTRP